MGKETEALHVVKILKGKFAQLDSVAEVDIKVYEVYQQLITNTKILGDVAMKWGMKDWCSIALRWVSLFLMFPER